MYDDVKEYLNWYDTRSDLRLPDDAPIVGLVLQRSHLVTGDEGLLLGRGVRDGGARRQGALAASAPLPCCSLLHDCHVPFCSVRGETLNTG